MFRVKICGITSPADALHAVSCGADALGFVFFADSPRCVSPSAARAIIDRLPPFVTTVGLFVNEPVERIGALCDEAGIDLVQLHGDESPDDCRALGRPVIKALRVRDAASLAGWDRFPVRGILLDAWHPEKFGGTGASCDWNLAAELSAKTTVILAGGLNPDNVAEAVRMVRPYAVDVSSGVEHSPGRKDPAKVASFISAAKRHEL